jgi:hypothetical protein
MSVKDIEAYFHLQRTLKNSVAVHELSGIPIADRAHVVQTALSIYPAVENWVAQSGLVTLKQRVAATCLAIAATMPYIQPSVLIRASIFGLIMFAGDDVTDAVIGAQTLEQQEAMLTLLIEITKSGGESTYHDYLEIIKVFPTINDTQVWARVANAWAKFCQELKTFPPASLYYWLFAKRTELDLEATRTDLRWSKAIAKKAIYPTYEQYLQNSSQSITTSIYLSMLLAMVGEPVEPEYNPPPSYINLEALIEDILLISGRSVRLANDIRSIERDLVEQKINAIHILMNTQGLSEKEAEAFVFQDMYSSLQQIEEPISLLPSTLNAWGDMVKRLTWFSCILYHTTEFHQLNKEMLEVS